MGSCGVSVNFGREAERETNLDSVGKTQTATRDRIPWHEKDTVPEQREGWKCEKHEV